MVLDSKTPKSHNSAPSPLRKAATYLSLVLLGAGVTFSSSYFTATKPLNLATSPSQTSSKALAGTLPTGNPLLNQDSNFITQVVEKVGPAVVRIDSSRTVTSQIPEAFNNPLFRQFFGSELPMGPQERVEKGEGSGFIINSNGQILTNAHVVDGADTVNVTLKDGRSFAVK
jgi:S1-C subfamily serine protease